MEMKLVTEREVIRDDIASWLKMYSPGGDGARVVDLTAKIPRCGITWNEACAALRALDRETCSRADITSILGGGRSFDNDCDFCGQHAETLLRLGEEPDYDNRWVDICSGCLAKAKLLFG